jgi:hypothetical protein
VDLFLGRNSSKLEERDEARVPKIVSVDGSGEGSQSRGSGDPSDRANCGPADFVVVEGSAVS